MTNWLYLLAALAVILLGSTLFTNSLEWFGKKLHLSDSSVGSIFAAVGTALPETLMPIIAILFGSKAAGAEIGAGAIIGAPFMLGTLALCISGIAVMVNRGKRDDYPVLRVNAVTLRRDMEYFLILYPLAIFASFLGNYPAVKRVTALLLLLSYCAYAVASLRGDDNNPDADEPELDPCYFTPRSRNPLMIIIIAQIAASLFLIVWGSYIFVDKVQLISASMGISPFILAMIIAPIATELPEKCNSVIWINKGKDALAIGNISGAMIFQGSVITAIGILMTDWRLNAAALTTAGITLASVGLAYCQIRWKRRLTPATLLAGGVFYLVFILYILTGT